MVGIDTGDDAAVWQTSPTEALVSTVDFFAPIVDDPFDWGAISAVNAVSDVYAMGGTPLFALNICAWPKDLLDLEILAEVFAGAASVGAGHWPVVGGHSVDGPEPLFGQAVTGRVNPTELMTNARACVGDVIVLTKPIGTGLVTTALKRSEVTGPELSVAHAAAITSMLRLNAAASQAARRAKVRAATDVTGFGLAGHLHKLCLASGVSAEIEFSKIPQLPHLLELVSGGFTPGGTERNLMFLGDKLTISCQDHTAASLVGDPQTSGPLLLCVPEKALDGLLSDLVNGGDLAAVIGQIQAGVAGALHVK